MCKTIINGKLAKDIIVSIESDPKRNMIVVTEDGARYTSYIIIEKVQPHEQDVCNFKDPDCNVEGNKDCAKTGIIYEVTCVAFNSD